MHGRHRHLLTFLTALAVLISDQISKFWAERSLGDGRVVHVIPGIFDFSLVYNSGAAFGILQGYRFPLVLVSAALVAVVIFYRRELAASSGGLRFGVGLLLGGAVGNLADRIFRGHVVDMLSFHWNNAWHFPTFNIADSCICCGVFLYALFSIIAERRRSLGNNDENA